MRRTMILGEKQMRAEDQSRFASVSGDVNPLHVDPLVARRTSFGRQVVHGVHTLLWSLDCFFETVTGSPPAGLDVRFAKPAFVGDTLCVVLAEEGDDRKRLEITASGASLVTIVLDYRAVRRRPPAFEVASASAPRTSPRLVDLAEIDGLQGTLPLADAMPEATSMFPAVTRALGASAVLALIATSRVVGMECPGMHSLFSGLTVDIDQLEKETGRLDWRVAKVDARFRRVNLDVCGGGISGRLETFLRAPPTNQLPMSEVCSAVGSSEFEGQHALIIGGSRGLGEVTAKVIAAGGGIPTVTYAVGREDAEMLAAEIEAAGKRCRTMTYDVRRPPGAQLATLVDAPASFYYFATGSIFQRKAGLYEPELLREFLSFYVDGFFSLCSELTAHRTGRLVGFYPSTVALEKPMRELTEYSLAKQAGELLCAHLTSFTPALDIVVKRLPRILTDQTATLFPVRSESPLEVMLPIVREVQAAAVASPN